MPGEYGEEAVERIIDQLAEGKSLAQICRGEGMPDRVTVWRWGRADDELAERIREARECGYLLRAEVAVANAKACSDPIKGRLAFDAERWMLGRLSHAFADKPLTLGLQVNVGIDAGDTFDAISRVLDEAAGRISSRAERTIRLADESEAGANPSGG